MGGSDSLPLGQFLWARLHQLGIDSVFGLPGDMNLGLLDYLYEVGGLHWVGNSNELNAAYAADGYSRIKGVPGVILTTNGVGELSALNGIAGAFSESVKVIHIVGTTPGPAREKRLMIHHSLGENPDHYVYDKISSHVRVAACWLDDEKTAADEVDRVIRECYLKSKPVYIYVPLDMVHQPVSQANLLKPLSLSPLTNHIQEEKALASVIKAIYSSRTPVLLVDTLIARYQVKATTQEVAEKLKFWTFCPPMGKSIIDETKPYYYGIYNGIVSFPGVQETVEKESDLVLHLGPFLSENNTCGFTSIIDAEKVIYVKPTSVVVKGEVFNDIPVKSFLETLLEAIDTERLPKIKPLDLPPQPIPADADSKLITQSFFWKRIGSFLRPGDLLFMDTGTSQFGTLDAEFPDVTFNIQGYFASLGHSLPMMLGGAMAHREMGGRRRVVLVVGDGSLQLSVQELGTVLMEKLDVVIMILNNNGYTIERALLKPEQEYHKIPIWDYKHMLPFFGHTSANVTRVATKTEFEIAVASKSYTSPNSIQVLEVMMDALDIPRTLRDMIKNRPGLERSSK